MNKKPKAIVGRLFGGHPFLELDFEFQDDQIEHLKHLLSRLRVDALRIDSFLQELGELIGSHSCYITMDKEAIPANEKIKAIENLKKKASSLHAVLTELTPAERFPLDAPLQMDNVKTGKTVALPAPSGFPEDAIPINLYLFGGPTAIDTFFDELSNELKRLNRICDEAIKQTLEAGRLPKASPEIFAIQMTQAYRNAFNQVPPSTREGIYEELVSFAGSLAGFPTADWHRHILKATASS